MEEQRTYYQVLGLDRSAPPELIKAARDRMLQRYHPDRHPGATKEERDEYNNRTAEIQKAYEVLGSEYSRLTYDRELDRSKSTASQSQKHTQGSTARSSSNNRSSTHDPNGWYRPYSEDFVDYGEFNHSLLQEKYRAAKQYVQCFHDCTKSGLKRSQKIKDDIAAEFLDKMVEEGILYKTTGGATRYHFAEVEESEPDDEDDDYEEETQPATKGKSSDGLAGCLGIIFWMVVGGWWGWHHFLDHGSTRASDASIVSSASPRAAPMPEAPAAEGQPTAAVPNQQAPSAIQGSAAELQHAPVAEGSSAPLSRSAETSPQNHFLANASEADTAVSQGAIPALPSSAGWRVVRETPPAYPIAALRAGEFGTTIVEVQLDAAGQVIHASVQTSSGYRDLDRAAVRAVQKFVFAPANGSRTAAEGTVLVPISFRQQ